MKKFIFEFFSNLVFSVFGFLIFVGIYNALEMLKLHVDFGGDKGQILFGLYFGLPLGSIFGILFMEKIIYKTRGYHIIGIVLAVMFSIAGVYMGTIMFDKIGGKFILFIPILIALISSVGYFIGLQIKK